MRRALAVPHLLVPLLVLFLAGCGGDQVGEEEEPDLPQEEEEVAMPETTGETSVEETPFVLTASDLDIYERGMRGGIARLEQAAEEKRAARSGTDTLQAMAVVVGSTLDQHMAQAAGVPLERFRAIREAVDEVLGKLQMGGLHAQMREQMDTTNVPPEQREAMRENLRQMEAAWGDPYGSLTPEAAEALRARADELAQLRTELLAGVMRLTR